MHHKIKLYQGGSVKQLDTQWITTEYGHTVDYFIGMLTFRMHFYSWSLSFMRHGWVLKAVCRYEMKSTCSASYPANDPGERRPLILCYNHGRDQQRSLSSEGLRLLHPQDILQKRENTHVADNKANMFVTFCSVALCVFKCSTRCDRKTLKKWK